MSPKFKIDKKCQWSWINITIKKNKILILIQDHIILNIMKVKIKTFKKAVQDLLLLMYF